MARSKKSQTKHDLAVKKLAREYKKKGYEVEADIKDHQRPVTIRGLRPDLRVRKGSHETAIEVETSDSVSSARDVKQQQAFKNWSQEKTTRHYRRVVTDE